MVSSKTVLASLAAVAIAAGSAQASLYNQVATPAFADLTKVLKAQPGYISLAPGYDGKLHAIFSGKAPAGIPATLGDLEIVIDEDAEWETQPLNNVDTSNMVRYPAGARPPTPEISSGLGPGSTLLINGGSICTANFIFSEGSNEEGSEKPLRYFLGAAGHCFLDSGAVASHGPGADSDIAGQAVEVCVAGCSVGGQLSGLLGTYVTIGEPKFARQSLAGQTVGNDFGVAEIPEEMWDLITPDVPVWGGPTKEGVDAVEFLRPVGIYGNGVEAGTLFPTKGRLGFGFGDSGPGYQAILDTAGGDSGSGTVHADQAGLEIEGAEALGIHTHGIAVPGVPLASGSLVPYAIELAAEAGLELTLVKVGDEIATASTASPAESNETVEAAAATASCAAASGSSRAGDIAIGAGAVAGVVAVAGAAYAVKANRAKAAFEANTAAIESSQA